MQRGDRVAEAIRKVLAQTISRDLKDPDLPAMVSVTEVVMNRDLSLAKVYVSTLSTVAEGDRVLKVLQRAMPFLRRQVAEAIQLRLAPELRFYLDDSLERGLAMDALIDQVRAEDAAKRPPEMDEGESQEQSAHEEA